MIKTSNVKNFLLLRGYDYDYCLFLFSVGKSDADEGETDDGEKGPEMDRREVIRRLRDRMEPILLFGETLSEACDR